MRKTVPLKGQSAAPAAARPHTDLNELLIFTRVVQAGSFTAAARLLGMPKSTVSRKVLELEERTGSRLLHRTTRKVGLTDAGRIYFDYGARIVAEAEEAERALGSLQSAPRGLLRVTAPLSFSMLAPVVADYLRRFPDVQLDLMCTDRRVDLVEEGFDLAVRTGWLDDSTLIARPLGVIRRQLLAAPRYLRRHGTPRTPADLARHTAIAFLGGAAPAVWTLLSGDQRVDVRVAAKLTVNELDVLGDVVRGGLGVALVPEFAFEEDLRERRLIRLLPEWSSEPIRLQAVYPTARHLSPKVAAFVDLLADHLAPADRRRGASDRARGRRPVAR